MLGGHSTLCSGTAHGLKVANEKGEMFLYHANNAAKLTKTKLDGSIVWQITGNFGQDKKVAYRPTWFGVPHPDSPYVWLVDGYGSNNVYVFTLAGNFTGKTYGGKGGPDQHGKFATNHGVTFDPRVGKLVVSDRENHRLEYFDFDMKSPNVFDYNTTVTLPGQRPCNIQIYPEQDGRAIVADLAGTISILDKSNKQISSIAINKLLGYPMSGGPHDAMFLPNGDIVVGTWSPGGKASYVSYWKKLPTFEN